MYQVEEASGGAPAILMILSNESHNLVQDQVTGLSNYTGAFTRVKILEGVADVTSQWVIRKQDSSGVTSTTTYAGGSLTDIGLDPIAGLGTYPIQVTHIDSNSSAEFITITATKGATTLNKQFSLSKIIDPAGSIILDIDSSTNGFAFSPTTQGDKQLTATLYLDGTPVNLTTGFEWSFDTSVQPSITNQISVSANQVEFNLTVRARVSYRGSYYSRVINLVDVKDALGLGILYTTRNTDGVTDATGNPISDNDKPDATCGWNYSSWLNGNITWNNNTTGAVFMTLRKQDDSQWSTPIRIKGEHGDQGPVGNYIKHVYRWSAAIPSPPQGNPLPNGWFDTPPTLVANQVLWVSIGEVTSATPSLINGSWSSPVQISGTNGLPSVIPGPRGPAGDPILSTGFTTERLETSIGSTIPYQNNTIQPNVTNEYAWLTVQNNMTIPRHVVIKYSANGYNDSTTNNSNLVGGIDFTQDYSLGSQYAQLVPTCGQSWGESIEFRKKIQGESIPANLVGVSIHTVPANTTLYFRLILTNSGLGTLQLQNITYNTFLI